MSDLPATSEDDLRRMGITPEMIRDALQRNGKTVEGDIKGFYLPSPGDHGNGNIVRARNQALSDWTVIQQRDRVIHNQQTYTQTFKNFEGDKDVEFAYSHQVTETKGIDYSQTKSFDVSVNANIPIGKSGAMLGITASMSSTEVASKSWSKSESRNVAFPVSVPAHEGRKVTEITTESSIPVVWEAKIRATNCVGIKTGTFWYDYYYWFWSIENIFPNNSSYSYVDRAIRETTVDTNISKITQAASGGDDSAPRTLLEATVEATVAPDHDESRTLFAEVAEVVMEHTDIWPGDTEIDAAARLTITVDFQTPSQEVPMSQRAPLSNSFRNKLMQQLQSILSPPGVGGLNLNPPPAPKTATIVVTYNAALATRLQVQTKSIAAFNQVAWGGKPRLIFT